MKRLTANHVTATTLPQNFTEPGWFKRLQLIWHGIRQPRHTKAYKEAYVETQRLAAPVSAIMLPLTAMMLLILLATNDPSADHDIVLHVIDNVDIIELKKTELLPEVQQELDTLMQDQLTDMPITEITTQLEHPDNIPTPQVLNQTPVQIIRSPIKISTIIGTTSSAEMRQTGRDVSGGNPQTEAAVMRSLRWLKKNQQPDGSWRSQRIAMTSLAILTYLAHGEGTDPASSPEFANTLRKALEYLCQQQHSNGRFKGADGNEYAHPIATYALCEAYNITRNPNLKAAATLALTPIIAGQHPTGGWTYKLDPNPDPATGNFRDDTSYMGWCVQALKAAQLAGLDVDRVNKSLKLAIRGFKRNAAPGGGFGYTSPGKGGLTSVGTLALQLAGAAGHNEVRHSLTLMDNWQPSFEAQGPMGSSLQYYFYYATQCRYHAGGKRWDNWNNRMKQLYVEQQRIEKHAIANHQGVLCDIGWWENADAHTDRPVMDTCLAALQLMVYYRSLITTQPYAVKVAPELLNTHDGEDDIKVFIPSSV